MDNFVNILGIDFSKLNLKATFDLIDSKVSERSNKIFHFITANPEIAVQIQEDQELKKISLEADLITPDGLGIVFASRLKGNPVEVRVTGYDLLLETLKVGQQKGWSFYLLGSDEEVNRKASEYIIENYPNVKIAGRHHGMKLRLKSVLIYYDRMRMVVKLKVLHPTATVKNIEESGTARAARYIRVNTGEEIVCIINHYYLRIRGGRKRL